ncbi:MAG: hypothetical protein AAGH79_17515 [Bacteroidota bacterium]
MQRAILTILASIVLFSACSKEETILPEPEEIMQIEIPFPGEWSRQFEAGPGSWHTATYQVYEDSIRYLLTGPVGNADYVMLRDTFLPENNRFIGHTSEGQHYLILVKDSTADSISLYKQKIDEMEEGLAIEVPDAATTENHGWNTYYIQ